MFTSTLERGTLPTLFDLAYGLDTRISDRYCIKLTLNSFEWTLKVVVEKF